MVSNKKIISDIISKMSKCYTPQWTVILLDDNMKPIVTKIDILEKPDSPVGSLTNPEIKELTSRVLNLFKRFQRQPTTMNGLKTTINSATYEWNFSQEWVTLIVSFERK